MVSLTNLKSFNASYNPNLFGKLRVDYESWGKLTSLDLSHCRFGGYLEDGYGDHWPDIEHLDISENNFGDVIPENVHILRSDFKTVLSNYVSGRR